MADKSDILKFNLIIEKIDPSKTREIVAEFARAFSLSSSFAEQVLKVVPVLFLDQLNKAEIKIVMSRLVDVSKKGVEFRVTAREPKGVPRVEWPVRPINPFGWDGNSDGAVISAEKRGLVCPSCGEAFLLQPTTGIRFSEAPRSISTARMPTDLSTEELAIADELRPMEGVDPIMSDSHVLDSLEDPDLIPVDELPMDELDEVPAASAGRKSPASGQGQKYNVFLSKISSPKQKEDAAKLLAEVKGIGIQEARAMADKTVIPVAKDVTKAEAEAVLARFEKIKVPGHINSSASK